MDTSMIKKILTVLVCSLSLTACVSLPYGGTFRFDGPGTFQDFAQARYQCTQETSRRVSGAYVNQYGGSSSSNVMPSCSAFSACLAAKGYYRNPNGRLDASAIRVDCN